MTIIPISGDGSQTEALAINTLANELRTTIAGIWDLNTTSAKPPAAEQETFLQHTYPSEETVLEGDERESVDPADILPGGKYRCKKTDMSSSASAPKKHSCDLTHTD